MDNMLTQELTKLGIELTTLTVKGTATAVSTKIRAIKDEKNADKIRNVYDEIINELLQEKDEAVRIAHSYKSELDRVVISDEDIEHLQNTISRLIEIFKPKKAEQENESENAAIYEQAKALINKDTLKTMQLLGFNYKAAIGEPLTQLCAVAITSFANKRGLNTNKANMNKGR